MAIQVRCTCGHVDASQLQLTAFRCPKCDRTWLFHRRHSRWLPDHTEELLADTSVARLTEPTGHT